MKKLVIIISSMSFGGAEIQTLQLANGLLESDYDIDIIVLDNMNYSVSKADPRIRFHFMDKQKYLDMDAVKKIADLLKGIDPDQILCVDMYPAMYAAFSQLRLKKTFKTVTVIHSTIPRNSKEKFQRILLMPFLNQVQRIVFVSEKQKNYWLEKYPIDPSRTSVIYNGIDIGGFSDFTESEDTKPVREYLDADNSIIIGTCARFRIEKRHTDLVKAVSSLKAKGYNVKLLLAGDGEMRESIEKCIKDHSIEEDSYITGYQSDVRPYLSIMDIFVLSSDSVETLSIAAIEALAMKKALVLSDIGGASELVNEGVNGYLYKAADVKQLTERLEDIIASNSAVSMGERGYNHALENFRAEDMVESYRQLFDELESPKGHVKYLYRIDDIHPQMMWDRFYEIMEIFGEYDTVPLLGLIPDNRDESIMFDPENPEYYDIIKSLVESGKAQICQHGFTHVYTTVQNSVNQYLYGRVSPSEFANLSYETQYQMIQEGRHKLQSAGLYTDSWMAPSHTNDKRTFRVLKNLGFKYVTDGIALFPYEKYGLIFIPQQIWEPKKEFGCGVFTICLHLDDLTDELIEEIRQHLESDDHIISFEEAVDLPRLWYYPLINNLYKGKRIVYFHIVRRYRDHKAQKGSSHLDIRTRTDMPKKKVSKKQKNASSKRHLMRNSRID